MANCCPPEQSGQLNEFFVHQIWPDTVSLHDRATHGRSLWPITEQSDLNISRIALTLLGYGLLSLSVIRFSRILGKTQIISPQIENNGCR